MLPKVHKNLENPPGTPIISWNESITEPASLFVHFFIKPFVSELPSFIRESTHVLNKTKDFKNFGPFLLVTVEVEALYTNIDHMEGLDALSRYLEKRHPEQMPPSAFILQLAEWTLHNNVFLFQNQFFKQKRYSNGSLFCPKL